MLPMLKAAGSMAVATFLSRILGLVREMVYARFMGNGWVASAFQLAFQIPNLFRRLLGEGALTAAFIPHFKEVEKTRGETAMWESANAVVSGLWVASAVLVGGAILLVSALLGFGDWSVQTRLMLDLLRLMFPYTALVCFAAVCVGMLNARGRFFVPALGAALLNVVLIASVVIWAPRLTGGLPGQIYALAWGVLAAGFAQAAFQVPSLIWAGWRIRWINPWRHPSVVEVVRRMVPATVGAATFQLNVVITQGFAFFVGDSIVASFQYAVRLLELPQGLFVVSVAAYLLPTLSGLAAEKRYADFRSTLLEGLEHLMAINLLAGVLLIGLARPIIRLLFQGGAFGPSATVTVAGALVFLAPCLLAYSWSTPLTRAFYALGDTKVPMQISVFCLAANAVLALIFVMPLQERGLAFANTLTATANAALLAYALRRKLKSFNFEGLGREAGRMAWAALVAGVVAWFGGRGWEDRFGMEGLGWRVGAVMVPAAVGGLIYVLLLALFRVRVWTGFWDRAVRRGAKPVAGGESR